MATNLSGHTKHITDVDGVIKVLVTEKGLSLWGAFKEYEGSYGQIPEIIKASIIWQYDHQWQLKEG